MKAIDNHKSNKESLFEISRGFAVEAIFPKPFNDNIPMSNRIYR